MQANKPTIVIEQESVFELLNKAINLFREDYGIPEGEYSERFSIQHLPSGDSTIQLVLTPAKHTNVTEE